MKKKIAIYFVKTEKFLLKASICPKILSEKVNLILIFELKNYTYTDQNRIFAQNYIPSSYLQQFISISCG